MRFVLSLLVTATMSAEDISVNQPWARATAPSAVNGAIFAEIANAGAAADELISASVAPTIADHIELHAHTKDGHGVMRMTPVPFVSIPGGGKTALKPGGFHIMLLGLKHPLIAGQQIPVTLTFAHAGRMEATAIIGSIAASESPADAVDCCAPEKK